MIEKHVVFLQSTGWTVNCKTHHQFCCLSQFSLEIIVGGLIFFKSPLSTPICAKNTTVEYRGSVFSLSLANFLKFGILHSSGFFPPSSSCRPYSYCFPQRFSSLDYFYIITPASDFLHLVTSIPLLLL